MSTALDKKSILKKTIEVGSSTMLSRVLGIIREFLQVRYLGAGAVSDVFFTAYKVPNSLRRIFAEGALSAAFVPTLVNVVCTEGKEEANRLMSLAFLFFEGILCILCAVTMIYAGPLISTIAPGFSAEQVELAIPFLRILMPFILFISSSALLASALQSVNHFFVPAFSPVLLNIVFIGGLLVCSFFSLPVTYLCAAILFGGFLQFCFHVKVYFQLQFSFGSIDRGALRRFVDLFFKFLACLSMGIVEISLFIATSFASYLPKGSISMIYYANGFMRIPIGVFVVSFSTILLPHFSRVRTLNPEKLNFYVLEAAKFVLWVTIPVALVMGFFAQKIFATVFLSDKFTMLQVDEAAGILQAFVAGLFFIALNKILLNVYYAYQVTWIPSVVALMTAVVNIALDWVLIGYFQATGLALAITLSMALQTLLLVMFLQKRFNFLLNGMVFSVLGIKGLVVSIVKRRWSMNIEMPENSLNVLFPMKDFCVFLVRYAVQLSTVLAAAYVCYRSIVYLLLMTDFYADFLINGLGLWFWVAPCTLATFALLYFSRKQYNVQLYFLDMESEASGEKAGISGHNYVSRA